MCVIRTRNQQLGTQRPPVEHPGALRPVSAALEVPGISSGRFDCPVTLIEVRRGVADAIRGWLDEADRRIVALMQRYGTVSLRWSLGLVFFWFGFLKLVGASPAAELVSQTVFWWDAAWFLPVLGLWECAIGLLFIRGRVRLAIVLMFAQMIGTFVPFVILPATTGSPLLPTLEGQYILKNVVLIAAALVIGSHARDQR